MTGLQWLAQNIKGPLVSGIDFGLSILVLAYWVMDWVRAYAVKGTRRRYVAATFQISIGPVVIATYVWDAVEGAAKGDWFWFALFVLMSVYVYRHWRKLRDEDSWWNGRGKKIWKSIKSRMTVRKLQPIAIR